MTHRLVVPVIGPVDEHNRPLAKCEHCAQWADRADHDCPRAPSLVGAGVSGGADSITEIQARQLQQLQEQVQRTSQQMVELMRNRPSHVSLQPQSHNSVVANTLPAAAAATAADSAATTTVADSDVTTVVSRKRAASKQLQRQDSAKQGKLKKSQRPECVERARCDELPVAVKIFEKRHRDMRDHERVVLNVLKLNNNVPSVVDSVDVCDGRPALIVSPAGDKVLPVKDGVRTNKTDFVKLLYVLKHAHSLNICHRDVKPHNIFKDKNGRIILSDWSSAAQTGTMVPWAGTVGFYDKQDGDHSPRPSDDLVALVRSIYVMYTNGGFAGGCQSSLFWRRALQYAEHCEHDNLAAFFNEL